MDVNNCALLSRMAMARINYRKDPDQGNDEPL